MHRVDITTMATLGWADLAVTLPRAVRLQRLVSQLKAQFACHAVALLQETMVDLVITDYNMPEMDGRELTEYIRTQSWQNTVPVLMVTSEQNMGRLAAVERAGVSAICDKPFEAGSIRKLIAESLLR